MKRLLFSVSLISLFSVSILKAQTKAVLDNNQFIVTVQTVAPNHQTHYKMTNNGTASMDFSLCKEMKSGGWDVTHHLDLRPGETYEDVAGFTGYTGKYMLFSAPHNSMASFPYGNEVAAWSATPPPVPPAPDPAPAAHTTTVTPVATPTTTTAPATTAPPVTTVPADPPMPIGRPDPLAPDPPKTPKP